MTRHDIKRLAVGVALGFMALPLHAQQDGAAEEATAQDTATLWVSDSLTTYVRSGPTDGYRIVGTLSAGDPVMLLETDGSYSRVEGPGGGAVWVPSSELQETPSAQARLPELEQRVAELTAELDGIDEQREGREARIGDLEARNRELDAELEQARRSVRQLQARLDTQEEDLLMRYFLYGGSVAGAGLLVGLIVPHLPRRRRKRDRWF